MTPARRLAVKISSAVVRWASPGSKEWVEGLEREVEFISSDWAALGWAIGGLRVVLDRQGRVAGRSQRHRTVSWYVFPIVEACQIVANTLSALKASNLHDRIGSGLLAFGWMCWAALSFIEWLWKFNEPPTSDVTAYRLYSRATLERRLKHYRSVRRWFPLLVPALLCSGYVMSFRGDGVWGYVFSGFVIVAGAIAVRMLCLDTPAKIQTRLDRVNERIAESGSGSL